MMKKGLVIGVILLFLGVALAPSINGKIVQENDYLDVTIDIINAHKTKTHTARLSQEKFAELDKQFDEIRTKLNNAETSTDRERIFQEAIVTLDNLGMLKGTSVNEIKQSISEPLNKKNINPHINQLLNQHYKQKEIYSNTNCYVTGEASNMGIIPISIPFILLSILIFFPPVSTMIGTEISLLTIYFIIERLFENGAESLKIMISDMCNYLHILLIIILIGALAAAVVPPLFSPINVNKAVTFGGGGWNKLTGIVTYIPSEGWIYTDGAEGVKEWNGTIYGQLGQIGITLSTWIYVGMHGFSGIRISNGDKTYFLGYAKNIAFTDSIE